MKMDIYLSWMLVLLFWIFPGGDCHGRLVEPPSRASMWRFGYKNPQNFADNQMFCGGYTHQWQKNGGRCGICGDAWDDVRQHEAGGKYANGIIVRRYQPSHVILVIIELTAAHLGYFEFRICPNDNPKKRVEQECLDRHVLELADDSGTRYYITDSTPQNYEILLKLPKNMECSQCLIQWMYHTGNSWGQDGNNPGCLGCGPQEEFYGCADVAIGNQTMFDEEYYVLLSREIQENRTKELMLAREIQENRTRELESQKITGSPPTKQPAYITAPPQHSPSFNRLLFTDSSFNIGANVPGVPSLSETNEENEIDKELMDFLNVMWQTMFQTIQAQLREYGGVFKNATLPKPPDFQSQFPELYIKDGDEVEIHIQGKEHTTPLNPMEPTTDGDIKKDETDFANLLMKATAERKKRESNEVVSVAAPKYLPNHIARSITTQLPKNNKRNTSPAPTRKKLRKVKRRRPRLVNPTLKLRKTKEEKKVVPKNDWFEEIVRAVNPNYNPELEKGKDDEEDKDFLAMATTHASIMGAFVGGDKQ